ncbi:Hypothetical predicted protein [Olea europaea subsp. europaea]|uniref:Short-chain dehydrogenase TIC 32, chloroplastic n=1 Tax=Olea europaea subsp. europaea TaxID=158383 RepID=A0A8S0VMJ3_OLEEU|nr:Hypothetical predicted protein [Olea europaea subsp. europaea]
MLMWSVIVNSTCESIKDYTNLKLNTNCQLNHGCYFILCPWSHFSFCYTGHFLLTHLLVETMKKTAREMKREGRIVNVSSVAHRFTYSEGIRFNKLNDKEGYNSWAAYGQSKLANILHANELARRLKEDGAQITANSLHPGSITTNLFRHLGVFEGFLSTVGKFVFKNIPQGASTTCYVALHPQVKGMSGEYFSDNNVAKPSLKAADTDLSKKLWDFSMDLIK